MRLFIGLPVPTNIQCALRQAWRSDTHAHILDKLTESSSWHMTLAFLDNVPENRVARVEACIEISMKHPPAGDFIIDGFKTFPEKYPTCIVAHVIPESLKRWRLFVDTIRDLISVTAPYIDRKLWKPHISIVRRKKDPKLYQWSKKIKPPLLWKPTRIALIQSTLSTDGPTYQNLHVFPLNI